MSIRQGDIIISGLGTMLPAQSGQSGKFLTTDGSTVSWGDVDTFPDQVGNSGKFLTTNGQAVSWATVTIPTVDQTYSSSSTSTNALSHKAIANAKFIQNTATGVNSITILGSACSNTGAMNIGELSSVGLNGSGSIAIGGKSNTNGSSAIAIGYESRSIATNSIAIGCEADAREYGSIQLGKGINSTAGTLYVGLQTSSSSSNNYKLLGSDGKIPDDRLNTTIARTSQIPTTVAELTDASDYALVSSLATVATSGDYDDLTNKPTIPSSVSDLSDAANYVTTNTAQNITAVKTFVGEKRIYFKQSSATDKLGFTLTNSSNTELATFEYRPNTVDTKALLSVAANNDYVGFRYWYSGGCNIIAPKPTIAGNYYIPVNITDGSTTVTANNTGTVDISTLLPSALPSQTGNSGKFLTTDGSIASWATLNYVTTNTAQNITDVKTFVGDKRIIFKQSSATDKLGFTLRNNSSSSDLAGLEYNPTSSALVDNKPVLTINSNGTLYCGFRYWGSRSSNILAGVPTTAGNYFIPVNITNGTTTVTADNTGTVNISSIIPDALPSQSGNSGKFLTTNGTTASWATVTQPSIATTSTTGLVKPDGTTITITNDGTISAASGAYAMVIVDYTAEEE